MWILSVCSVLFWKFFWKISLIILVNRLHINFILFSARFSFNPRFPLLSRHHSKYSFCILNPNAKDEGSAGESSYKSNRRHLCRMNTIHLVDFIRLWRTIFLVISLCVALLPSLYIYTLFPLGRVIKQLLSRLQIRFRLQISFHFLEWLRLIS